MNVWCYKKLHDCLGQSLVEFALLLPFLLSLGLGIFDLSRAIYANNAIINISREGASLALRTSRDSVSAEDLMNSLAATAEPLNLAQGGAMFITEIRMSQATKELMIATQNGWSKNTAGAASRLGAENLSTIVRGISIDAGQSVYVFEVSYRYSYLFIDKFIPSMASPVLYSTTIF